MRRSILFVACLALSVPAAVPAGAALNRWSTGGPAGGPVDALAFDPFDPAIVYAGTWGGVFRSEDHGATWTAASSGLDRAQVQELAVDPDTPGTVYALTDRGVQKSLDRGLTWQPSALFAFVDALALDPAGPGTLYTSIQGTIQKSTNGGASWTPGQKIGNHVSAIEIAPSSPAVVYAATDTGIFKSTNAGGSWSPAAAIDEEFFVSLLVDPANPQVVYAGTEDGLYKSTNGGASWSRSGLDGQTVEEIEVDPSAPSALFVLAEGIYRSTNGGASWTLLDGRFSFWNSRAIAGDPSGSAWLAGTSAGAFRSIDHGATWQLSNAGITASGVDNLIVDPHRPGVLYATMSEDLFRSTDAGTTWSPLPGIAHVRALAVDPRTPSRLYAGALDGVWRSQDGGTTWLRINNEEIAIIDLVIDPSNPSVMYAGRSQAGVRKSVDGGFHWSAAGPDLEGYSSYVLRMAPSDPQTLYTSGFPGVFFRSTDGGASWTEIGGDLPNREIRDLAVDPHDPDVVYAAPMNARLYKSSDGGDHWVFIGNSFPFSNVEGIAIDPSDPSRLYASNLGLGIFRSTNGGGTWASFSEGLLSSLETSGIVLDPVNPFLLYAESFGAGVLARADLQPGSSLRLNGNRFLVKVSWATGPGVNGRGQAQALTGDTGYAWFFQESNVEVLLKVLNGCGITGHFWVFAAGLTNVRTDITVADNQTGAVKIYHNPLGQPFQPIQDTGALACGAGTSLAGESAAAAARTAGPSAPILLQDGRFRVTAEFAISPIAEHHPAEGAKLTDDAAYLWFFDPNNVEVFLKVVDGCPVNGRFWVFAAGLTNLEVRITVEDLQTGAQKVYVNPSGTAFQPIQDTEAFQGCG